MKYLELLPNDAHSLKQSLKAIKHNNGKAEELDLSYAKLSQIATDKFDFIFSHFLLDGEALILKNISDFIVINDRFYEFCGTRKVDLKLKGKTLQIGTPVSNALVTVTNNSAFIFTSSNIIEAVYPLPFREESFDNVVVSEVLDYDIIKEASRVLKKQGVGYLIINAFKKVRPVEAIKIFSIRFIVRFVVEKNGFWIIEGTKKN